MFNTIEYILKTRLWESLWNDNLVSSTNNCNWEKKGEEEEEQVEEGELTD